MSSRASVQEKMQEEGRQRRWKLALAVNLIAALFAVVAWVIWRTAVSDEVVNAVYEGDVAHGIYRVVDDVGYLPKPDRRFTARRLYKGHVTYDVVYTIGPDGFRIVPGSAKTAGGANSPSACVLLFGDSITFGEGVNDDETYAAQLARRGRGQWIVYDFGVPGWAAHETLAGLQSGRFQRSLACKPTHAVFFLISDHYRRIAGYAPWEQHTPRYRLSAEGHPVRDGSFDSDGPPALAPPDDGRSLLTRNGWRRVFGQSPLPSPLEAGLMQALLIEIANTLKETMPGIRFDVLFWTEEDNEVLDELATVLKKAHIGVHPVERIIPDYRAHWAHYLLPDEDRHPTAATHGLIADYIAREIVGR